ncbi:hypothetical protein ACIBG0_01105 [Nocardia sp. NPDC050630]|uniref:hypothetical protein n=1 Tax=Nocardia sp. NPDC050630 TaxID=3364321 RepID=UPI0037A5FDB5
MAFSVALAMGVVTNVIQRYLDPQSPFSAQIVPSIPFMFMLVFLLYCAVRARPEVSGAGHRTPTINPFRRTPRSPSPAVLVAVGYP